MNNYLFISFVNIQRFIFCTPKFPYRNFMTLRRNYRTEFEIPNAKVSDFK